MNWIFVLVMWNQLPQPMLTPIIHQPIAQEIELHETVPLEYMLDGHMMEVERIKYFKSQS